MATSTPNSPPPIAVLYVAGTAPDADAGVRALEAADASLVVEPAAALETVRERIEGVDCVVFGETPTTAAGAQLLEVAAICRETPLILYSEPLYGPAPARETEGVDGYVRRTVGSVEHLVDEIRWCCRTPDSSRPVAIGDGTHVANRHDGIITVDAAGRITDANEPIEQLLGTEARALRGTPLSALSAAGILSRADTTAITAAVEQVVTGETTGTTLTATIDAGEPLEVWLGVSSTGSGTGASAGASSKTTAGTGQAVIRVRPLEGTFEQVTEVSSPVPESAPLHASTLDTADSHPATSRLFECLPDPAIRHATVDGSVVVRDVNAAFEHSFGYEKTTSDETIGYLVPADIENTLERAWQDESAGSSTTMTETATETQTQTATGTTIVRKQTPNGVRRFLVTHLQLSDDEMASLYRDVTDQTRTQRQLKARNERLEQVTHLVETELQPALNVAVGSLELVRATRKLADLAEVETGHQRVKRAIDRLRTQASNMSILAETEPVALHDSAKRAWADVDTGRSSLECRDDTVLEADRARLTELLESVFLVAVDAGPAGLEETTAVGAGAETEGRAKAEADAETKGGTGPETAVETQSVPASNPETESEPTPTQTITVDATDTGFTLEISGCEQPVWSDIKGANQPERGDKEPIKEIAAAHGWTLQFDHKKNQLSVDGARLEPDAWSDRRSVSDEFGLGSESESEFQLETER